MKHDTKTKPDFISMDIMQKFLSLPSVVTVSPHQFYLRILHNGTDDARLIYALDDYTIDSYWYNPYLEKDCTFLILFENIQDVGMLSDAIDLFKIFLRENKLFL